MNTTEQLSTMDRVNLGLAARYRKEKRFRLFGLSAIVLSLAFLVLLLGSIGIKGYTAFQQTCKPARGLEPICTRFGTAFHSQF